MSASRRPDLQEDAMIASSSPGMTLEVLKADIAARARAAEERRHLAAMTREFS